MTLPYLLNSSIPTSENPQYYFFYPQVLRPVDFTATLGGNLWGSPSSAPGPNQPQQPNQPNQPQPAAQQGTGRQSIAAIVDRYGSLRAPWSEDEGPSADAAGAAPTGAAPTGAAQAGGGTAGAVSAGAAQAGAKTAPALDSPELTEDFRAPARAASPAAPKAQGWTSSGTWTFAPTFYNESRYNYDAWTSPEDIDYSLNYNLWSYRLAGTLTGNLGYGDYLSSSLALNYLDQNLLRTMDNDPDNYYTNQYKNSDQTYVSRRVSESARLSFKPFAESWLWSATSLSYGLDATLYSNGYVTNSSTSDTSLTPQWVAWNPTMITAHNLTLSLGLRPGGQAQTLSLTANLPPEVDSYSGNLALAAGVAALTLASGVARPAAEDSFLFSPATAGLTIGKAPWPVLSDSFVYNYVQSAYSTNSVAEGAVSNTTNLSWGPLNSSLAFTQTQLYLANVNNTALSKGWLAYGSTAFRLSSLNISLAPSWSFPGSSAAPSPTTQTSPTTTQTSPATAQTSPATAQTSPAAPAASSSATSLSWSIAPSLSLTQSLVECSQSNLVFSLTASLKIGDKFTFSFSSSSQNSAVWEYYAFIFPSVTEAFDYTDGSGATKTTYVKFDPSSYQINPLTDLWESISIWDTDALTKGNFKLSTLSIQAAQDLHDWTLSLTASTTPVLDTTVIPNKYHFNTAFSINLAWKDITAIKSAVTYNTYVLPSSGTNNLTY